MKKKMALALILFLVVSNSMVAFGAGDSKDRTAKSTDGSTWEYWDGENKDQNTNLAGNEQEVTASYTVDTSEVFSLICSIEL